MFKKTVLLLIFATGFALQAMEENYIKLHVKNLCRSSLDIRCIGLYQHEEDKNCIGIIEYWPDYFKKNRDSFYLEISDKKFLKYGLGKLLITYAIADILTHYPDVKKFNFKADSPYDSYLSQEDLCNFYRTLGGKYITRDIYTFTVDLENIRKDNNFFDFKKISNFVRNGGTIYINPKSIISPWHIEGDGEVSLSIKSRI